MKMKWNLALSLATGFLVAACGNSGNNSAEQTAAKDSTKTEVVEAEAEVKTHDQKEAVAIWEAVGMRQTPNAKGKYLTTIYQGEKLTYLGETKIDESSSKKDEWTKVELSDGETGWVLERLIATEAQPAATTTDVAVYRRPDLLTQSDKEMAKRTFLVVLEEQDDWAKVKGIATGDNWFTEGWIEKKALTTDRYDVSFAILANKADKEKDEVKQKEMLDQLLNTDAFKTSVFFAELAQAQDKVEDVQIIETVDEETGESIAIEETAASETEEDTQATETVEEQSVVTEETEEENSNE